MNFGSFRIRLLVRLSCSKCLVIYFLCNYERGGGVRDGLIIDGNSVMKFLDIWELWFKGIFILRNI